VTDRGGAADVARVCPFVALDDDRDRRLDQPDHRHRCYAESPPAPRAIAHQEAFCLSPSFASCPVFQDWARREAASTTTRGSVPVRPLEPIAPPQPKAAAEPPVTSPPRPTTTPEDAVLAAGAGAAAGAASTAPPVPPGDVDAVPSGPWDAWVADDDADREAARDPSDLPRRRAQPREWAAPPPWSGGDAAPPPESHESAASGDRDAVAPPFLADRTTRAERGRDVQRDRFDDAEAAGWGDHDDRDEPWPEERRADPSQSARRVSPGAGAAAAGVAGAGAALTGVASGRRAAPPDYEDLDEVDDVSTDRPRRRSIAAGRMRDAEDAPPWEPRRRSEAYPALKTPMSLPRLGPLALAVIALAIAALALFFIVPQLLVGSPNGGGGGGGGGGGAATSTPSAGASAAASASPSSAAPTPLVYIVKQGDTLSRIAKKFNVTVDEIIAANPEVTNPDKIGLGVRLTIPTPGASVPEASGSPAASG